MGEYRYDNNYRGRLFHVNVIEDELRGDPYDLSLKVFVLSVCACMYLRACVYVCMHACARARARV